MSKAYQVTIDADFITNSSSPGDIHKRLLGLIAKAGFKETNFEIGITRLPEAKGGKAESAPKPKSTTKTKLIKQAGKPRRQART